jgi:hypothetical protein
VRGDSLRDLYAKTLAVVGLGLLAGVAAIVDYWPAGISYPVVARAFSPTTLLPAVPVSAQQARAVRRRSSLPSESALPQTFTQLPVTTALALYPSRGFVIDQSAAVALPATTESAPEPVAVMAIGSDGVTSEALVDVEMVDGSSWAGYTEEPPVFTMLAESEGASSGGRGFVGGALNKTTDTLVRTGRWTGASVVRAVRVARGVVGRAIPN